MAVLPHLVRLNGGKPVEMGQVGVGMQGCWEGSHCSLTRLMTPNRHHTARSRLVSMVGSGRTLGTAYGREVP